MRFWLLEIEEADLGARGGRDVGVMGEDMLCCEDRGALTWVALVVVSVMVGGGGLLKLTAFTAAPSSPFGRSRTKLAFGVGVSIPSFLVISLALGKGLELEYRCRFLEELLLRFGCRSCSSAGGVAV